MPTFDGVPIGPSRNEKPEENVISSIVYKWNGVQEGAQGMSKYGH